MIKRKNKKPIPAFTSEDQEREFWASHDSTEYVDWSRAAQATLPHLEPTATPSPSNR